MIRHENHNMYLNCSFRLSPVTRISNIIIHYIKCQNKCFYVNSQVLDITPEGRAEFDGNNMFWVDHKEKY